MPPDPVFTFTTAGTPGITFHNDENWVLEGNTVTYRTVLPRRAQRPLDIHPLLRDNTPPQPKPVMSDDAKAFWSGDHFHFDCK